MTPFNHLPSRHRLGSLAVILLLTGCLTDGRYILKGPGLPQASPTPVAQLPGVVTPSSPNTPLVPGAPVPMVQGIASLNGQPLRQAVVTVFQVSTAKAITTPGLTDDRGAFAVPLLENVPPGAVLLVRTATDTVTLYGTMLASAGMTTLQQTPVPSAGVRCDLATTIVTKRLLPKLAEVILGRSADQAGQAGLAALFAQLDRLAERVAATLAGPVQDQRLQRAIQDAGTQADNDRIEALAQAMVAYGDAGDFLAIVEGAHQAWLANLEAGGPAVGPRPWQVRTVRAPLPQLRAVGDRQTGVTYGPRSLTVDLPYAAFLDVPAVITWLEALLRLDAASAASPQTGGGGGTTPAPTPTPLVGIDTGVTIVDGTRPVQAGLISRIVSGEVGHEDLNFESGPAATAHLFGPMGLGTDSAGNLYIADMYHRRVRKVDTSGQLATFAGSGGTTTPNTVTTLCLQFGVCGSFSTATDGVTGPATAAVLGAPGGLAVDAADNVYIADLVRHCVRKVSPNGTITTVAGTPGTAGSTSARLSAPAGLAVNAQGHLFIADARNHRIQKVVGSTVTTVLGTGSAGNGMNQLDTPTGLAFDLQGNLYVADSLNSRVQKVAAGTGTVTTYAGILDTAGTAAGVNGDGGSATAATLFNISGLACDRQGNLYISGTGTNLAPNRIRKVTAGTGIITTYVGGGPSTTNVPPLRVDAGNPAAIAVDALGALYFSDRVKGIVQVVR